MEIQQPIRPLVATLAFVIATACLAAQPKPVSLDLRAYSRPFAEALSQATNGGLNADVSFLDEREIAVAVGRSFDESHARLTVDLFDVSERGLKHVSQRQYSADITDPKVIPTGSGAYLVNLGSEIAFVAGDGEVSTRRTVKELCGGELAVKEGFSLDARLSLSVGQTAGVLRVEQFDLDKTPWLLRKTPIREAPPALYCWFDVKTGNSIGHVSKPFPPYREANPKTIHPTIDDLATAVPGGFLTPMGLVPFDWDGSRCPKPSGIEEKFPSFSVFVSQGVRTRLETCGHGELVTSIGADTRIKSFGRNASPTVASRASTAPIVVLVMSPLNSNVFSGAISNTAHTVVYDYGRQRTLCQIWSDELPHMPGFLVTLQRYAVSPSGHQFAILNGAMLSVRELKSE